MEKDTANKVEFNVHDGGQVIIATDNAEVSAVQNNITSVGVQKPLKSRTQEYADKWNQNMFLNDFDERDENAGVNVKLSDIYLDEQLPHYIWGNNKNTRNDLKNLLKEYIYPHNNNMLLILGQPGIGKSTLITWITANFTDRVDHIYVYKFASDLKNVIWQNLGNDIKRSLLEELNILTDDLEGKILILDGFDEISVGNDRVEILNQLYWKLIKEGSLNKFSLIITCRENYIDKLFKINCNYITLQSWNEDQIRGFCKTFQEKTKQNISEYTIANILNNKEILGIPLILYMVLALNISIEKEGSIVDVYDQIFSLEDGGIYDRCINNKSFAEPHRIGEIKKQIHQISREIAFWMFENKADKAYIPQEEYEKICDNIMEEQAQENNELIQDFKIGSYFKLVKHCEGMETEELYFVHRSIYEYFVAEYIYNSIENAIKKLTDESQEELAGNIAFYLKEGKITYTIGEYLQYKVIKLLNILNENKRSVYKWIEDTVNKMLFNGMFYYTNMGHCRNIIQKELQCFMNLIEILRPLLVISEQKYIMSFVNRSALEMYIRYCNINNHIDRRLDLAYMDLSHLNLANMHFESVNFRGACFQASTLYRANLERSDLEGANLWGACLVETNLKETYLAGANLAYTNLEKANFINANIGTTILRKIDIVKLDEAKLKDAIFDEMQVDILAQKYNLQGIKVFIIKTEEYISYEEYCKRKQ